jgi:hypothetical protein
VNGNMKMNAQETKLQAAENDLKQLMPPTSAKRKDPRYRSGRSPHWILTGSLQ